MTAIMIFHIRSKYTAVGRKEIVTFFYLYAIIEALAIFLDSGIIPTSSNVYPWFAAVYTGLVAAAYTCLLINGFVGFQFAEDGTPLSLWICDAVKHYIDGLFFFTVCILLSVMMVYKYWDSITKEDLEFSVGSKAAVWEVKEPFLGNGGGAGEQWEEDAVSHYGGAAPSLVGGISGGQFYQHQQPPPPVPQGPGYNYPPPHGYGNDRF
ncbi:Chitin synthase, class 7 [Serendipita sp. 399]|nr:Chitin synthase, class 7 [Serendipita sp. 399]